MSKKTEPTAAVRALQAEAAADLARHRDPATALASKQQHEGMRANASENAKAWRGRR